MASILLNGFLKTLDKECEPCEPGLGILKSLGVEIEWGSALGSPYERIGVSL